MSETRRISGPGRHSAPMRDTWPYSAQLVDCRGRLWEKGLGQLWEYRAEDGFGGYNEAQYLGYIEQYYGPVWMKRLFVIPPSTSRNAS